MNNYISPNEMQEALKRAHIIRSQAVHDGLSSGRRRLTELFRLYNPQKRFRR